MVHILGKTLVSVHATAVYLHGLISIVLRIHIIMDVFVRVLQESKWVVVTSQLKAYLVTHRVNQILELGKAKLIKIVIKVNFLLEIYWELCQGYSFRMLSKHFNQCSLHLLQFALQFRILSLDLFLRYSLSDLIIHECFPH